MVGIKKVYFLSVKIIQDSALVTGGAVLSTVIKW